MHINIYTDINKHYFIFFYVFHGAPDRTRTYNPQLRRLMLYPVELRAPLMILKWSGQRDLNPRPSAPKADALPGCAMLRLNFKEVNRIILIKI